MTSADAPSSNVARAWGTREIDLTRAEKAACGYRFDLPDGVPPVFVLWARAALDALAEVPMLNSRWTDEAIHLHRAVDVGIEVPTGHGRIVPVIRDAAGLSIDDLAAAIADVTARAALGLVSDADCAGGTFTIGFSGRHGSVISRALLHAGQAGLYQLGAIRRMVRVADDALVIRTVCNASLTFDHRVLDGSTSSRFQNLVKTKLESWREE